MTPISGGANRNVSLWIGVTRKIVKKLRKRYSLVKKRESIVTKRFQKVVRKGE